MTEIENSVGAAHPELRGAFVKTEAQMTSEPWLADRSEQPLRPAP